jgi:hypothetical protein
MKGTKLRKGIGLNLLLIAVFFFIGSLTTQAWGGESYATAISPVSPEEPAGDVVTSPDGPEGILAATRTGKIIVINQSSYTVNVYLDDDLIYEDLDPNYKLTIRNVPRGRHELYAETANGSGSWGPTQFNLRWRYTWTLTD